MLEAHLRRIGFWTAVVVPLGYPIVLSTSAGEVKLAAVTGLIALNVAALLLGHRYDEANTHRRREPGSGRTGRSGTGS